MTGSSSLRRLLEPLVVVAVVCATYVLGGLDGPFVFDDREAILDNASLTAGALHELLWPPADTPVGGRPVVNLSFAASRALSGFDPLAFRAFNLALHVLTALSALGLLRRTLRSPLVGEAIRVRADGLAFAATLLWSVHPLLSETVLYASQRSELWFGFFYVAMLYAVARAAAGPRRWSALAVLACALGCLSKEGMVTAPIVALLYDRTFFAGSFRDAWSRRKGLYLGLFATWTIVITILVAAPRAQSVGFHADRGAGGGSLDYLLTQAELVPHYLRLLVWPRSLVFDYGTLRPVELDGGLVLRFTALVALFVATCFAVVRRPLLGFVGAVFFVVLAPTSSFVPILTEVGAERRMYVPALALVAGTLATLAAAAERRTFPLTFRAAVPLVAVLLVALSSVTVLRAREYASRVSIWTTVAERRPQNARAHFNLGVALTDEGRPLEALVEYRRALELRPDYAEAHDNLGNTLAMLGRFDEALVHNRRAVELWPGEARPLANLALTQYAAGRAPAALATIDRSLALDPASADAHQTRALALKALGRPLDAELELRTALRLDPQHAHAQYNLARLLAARGDPESLEAALRAVRLAPGDSDARLLAAHQLIAGGFDDRAVEYADAAFQILRARGRAAAVADAAAELAAAAEAGGRRELALRLRALARFDG